MQNDKQVKKIIAYLEGKISSLKYSLQKFETPMMQEMTKNSPHLQMEYTKLAVELQANEDNLLAIKTFTEENKEATPVKKVIRKKGANGSQ